MNHNFKFPPVLEVPFSKPAKVQVTLGESRELAPQMEKYTLEASVEASEKAMPTTKVIHIGDTVDGRNPAPVDS